MGVSDPIVFDIETVPAGEWGALDGDLRKYLVEREVRAADDDGDADFEALAAGKLGLSAGTGKVIVVGLLNTGTGGCGALIEGPPAAKYDWTDFRFTAPGGAEKTAKVYRAPEAELLTQFWRYIGDRQIISFNGRGFDGPFMMLRSIAHDVTPPRSLVPYRYSFREHCDLMDVLSFFGATRNSFSLDYWCRALGIESPKAGMDGSQVGGYYRAGKIDDVARYCLADVGATFALYERLRPLIGLVR